MAGFDWLETTALLSNAKVVSPVVNEDVLPVLVFTTVVVGVVVVDVGVCPQFTLVLEVEQPVLRLDRELSVLLTQPERAVPVASNARPNMRRISPTHSIEIASKWRVCSKIKLSLKNQRCFKIVQVVRLC